MQQVTPAVTQFFLGIPDKIQVELPVGASHITLIGNPWIWKRFLPQARLWPRLWFPFLALSSAAIALTATLGLRPPQPIGTILGLFMGVMAGGAADPRPGRVDEPRVGLNRDEPGKPA